MSARHLVLIGAMGSGKTSIGEALSPLVGMPLVDGDAELEARYGMTARDIADRVGGDELHEREAALALELLDRPTPSVIGPAASVVDDERVRARMRQELVVWLRAEPELLAARATRKPHRPFLEGDDAIARFVTRERGREPHYAEVADLVIDVTDKSKHARRSAAKEIAGAWQRLRATAGSPDRAS